MVILLIIGEDDTVAGVKQLISNDGFPIGGLDIIGTALVDDRHPTAWSSGPNEITLLYDPYLAIQEP